MKLLAWLLAALALLLAPVSVALGIFGGWSLEAVTLAAQSLAMPLFAAVGALILHRRSRHRLGWLLLLVGTLGALNEAVRRFAETQPLPIADGWGAAAVVTGRALGTPVFVVLTIVLPLVFPDGDVPSRRWRPVLWSLLVLLAVGWIPDFFAPGPVEWFIEDRHVIVVDHNPVGVAAMRQVPEVLDITAGLSSLWMLAAIAALVVRARRDRVVRLQIKWVGLALGVAISMTLLTAIPGLESEGSMLSSLAFLAVPIAVGIAITRYRLYEIDRIISRTVTYATVVGLLGLVILGLVTGMAIFLPSDDPLVVAVATLAVFALFNPVRRRVQGRVDRRFNRSRYDAARVIDGFTGSLQDRVDPEGVVGDWVGVVEETMQPASVGVWVRQ